MWHQVSFDQVSDRDRIVTYRDYGLSLREISQRVGRKQDTVKRVNCAQGIMDHVGTSRTTEQQIQSVTYHSVSSRTIRRSLQQSGISAMHPLLRFSLTGNHSCLRRKW
ncbi:transposable element Tcb1 transposase [Trichonephila clavipes]|nr:transposable element Tcb1 transposase [Trichonephila clavipes]